MRHCPFGVKHTKNAGLVRARRQKPFCKGIQFLLSDYDCHNVAGTPVTGSRKVDQQRRMYIWVYKDRAGASKHFPVGVTMLLILNLAGTSAARADSSTGPTRARALFG